MSNPYRTPDPEKCQICGMGIDDYGSTRHETAPVSFSLGKQPWRMHAECYQALKNNIYDYERLNPAHPRLTLVWRRIMDTLKKAWKAFLISLAIALAAGVGAAGLYPLGRFIVASGETTFCFVDTSNTNSADAKRPYQLHGHREWRFDNDLGKYETLDDAVKAAERIGCKVK